MRIRRTSETAELIHMLLAASWNKMCNGKLGLCNQEKQFPNTPTRKALDALTFWLEILVLAGGTGWEVGGVRMPFQQQQ